MGRSNEYVPSEGLAEKLLGEFKFLIPEDIEVSFPNDVPSSQEVLGKFFYGCADSLCHQNLASEGSDDETLREYCQVPENPKISIISDSRDAFHPRMDRLIREYFSFPTSEELMCSFSRDFYDHMSLVGRFSTKLGEFYLDSEKVYFKTEHSLPPKTPVGGAIAVGGVMKDFDQQI